MFIFFCQVSVEVFCSFLIGWSVFLLFIPVLYIFLMLSVLSNIHIAKIFQQSDLSFGFTAAAAAAESLQSCPTLCDPRDGSPPGENTGVGCHFLLQCMKSEKWKWSRSVMSELFATPWTATYQAPPPWDFPGKNTGMGCHCLLRWLMVSIRRRKFKFLKGLIIHL